MKNNIPAELRNASGIYEIRNLANGKVYVGSTTDFYKRYKGHKSNFTRHKPVNLLLLNAYLKYGIDAFEFNLVCEVKQLTGEAKNTFVDRLLESEWNCIQRLGANDKSTGYNIRVNPATNFGCIMAKRAIALELPIPSLPPKQHIGANSYLAVINEEVARQIKLCIMKGASTAPIARHFSVSYGLVAQIRYNKTWRHILLTQIELDAFQLPSLMHKLATGSPKGTKRNSRKLSKFSNQDLFSIKKLLQENTSIKIIAEKFNANRYTIKNIRDGKTWSNITGINPAFPIKTKRASVNHLKLTPENVLTIKVLLNNGHSFSRIGDQFNVHASTIRNIKSRKTWKHI